MYRYPGNHVDSGIVTVPRKLKTRPGAPETHLAYITPDEEKILQQYKPGTPHRGPEEIPNYDSWSWDSSGTQTGGSTADSGSGSGSWGSGWESNVQTGNNNVYQDLKDSYTHHDTVYGNNASNLPEDIVYDDKIADYSFSTPDVRASIMDKMKFRERVADAGGSGWAEATDAELLGLEMYKMTNNRAYLDQPIFVPKDANWSEIYAAWNKANETGNREDFFSVIDDYVDITHGNPNLSYFDKVSGTDWDGWWKRPTTTTGDGGGGGGGGGWSGSWGGQGGFGTGRGGTYSRRWNPHMKNVNNYNSPIAQVLAQREANKYNNLPKNQWMFTQMLQSMPGGGITEAI